MRDPSAEVRPRSWPGVLTFLAGGALAASAFAPGLRPAGDVAGVPAPLAQAGAGVLLMIAGVAWGAWALTRPPPPRAAIEAHVAFAKKRGPPVDPSVLAAPARPAPPPGLAREAKAVRPLTEAEQLDYRIRSVRSEIGRAKVMYGTGKISSDAYAKLVSELKRELAGLEAARAQAELVGG